MIGATLATNWTSIGSHLRRRVLPILCDRWGGTADRGALEAAAAPVRAVSGQLAGVREAAARERPRCGEGEGAARRRSLARPIYAAETPRSSRRHRPLPFAVLLT